MDPAPSDAITPGSAREGLTKRLPPRPRVVLPWPDVRLGRNPLAVVLALALGHAFLLAPLVWLVVVSISPNITNPFVPLAPNGKTRVFGEQ